ncbi:MAG: DUF421 domain-containing protein [Pirellulaceae bacterium]|nr:DUF421 domain-containing protein [Pirellulaceae bacterium]
MLADASAWSLFESLGSLVQEVFGGDQPAEPLRLHQIACRAAAVFFIGLALVRIGKTRLIGRVTGLDVLIGFLLGSILSRGITGQASISGTAIASATIVLLHWILTAIATRSHRFGIVIKGRSKVLVKDGAIDESAMLYSHISPNDLDEALHIRGLETVEQVRRAYQERNGEISVIKRKEPPKIIEISVQDGVQTVRIEIA